MENNRKHSLKQWNMNLLNFYYFQLLLEKGLDKFTGVKKIKNIGKALSRIGTVNFMTIY